MSHRTDEASPQPPSLQPLSELSPAVTRPVLVSTNEVETVSESGSELPDLFEEVDASNLSADSSLTSWEFDATALTSVDSKMELLNEIFKSAKITAFLGVDRETLLRFFHDVRQGYNDVKYHSFEHALNVAQRAYMLSTVVEDHMDHAEICALLLAALCIDIGHMGTNNNFHLTTKSELAVMYSFKDPLEKFHVTTGKELINKHKILEHLSKGQKDLVMDHFRGCILNSGVSSHKQLKARIQELANKKHFRKSPFHKWAKHLSSNERGDIVRFLLHSADISDQCKSWDCANWWGQQSMQEMKYQAHVEIEKGVVPSYNMHPHTASIGDVQLAYLDFIIMPVYQLLSEIFPALTYQLNKVKENRLMWKRIAKRDKDSTNSSAQNSPIHIMDSPRQENDLGQRRRESFQRRISRMPIQFPRKRRHTRNQGRPFNPSFDEEPDSPSAYMGQSFISRKSSDSRNQAALQRKQSTDGIPTLVTCPIGECPTIATLTDYDKNKLGMLHVIRTKASESKSEKDDEKSEDEGGKREKSPERSRVTFVAEESEFRKSSLVSGGRRGSVGTTFMSSARTSLAHLSKDALTDLSAKIGRRSSFLGQLGKDNKVAPASGAGSSSFRASVPPPQDLSYCDKLVPKIRNNYVLKRTMAAIDSTSGSMFVFAITLYALFGDDMKLYMMDKKYDDIFSIVSTVVLVIFGLELVITSLAKEGYFLKTHFFLDAVAAASIIFDIDWIRNSLSFFDEGAMLATEGTASENIDQGQQVENIDQARNARIVRMMRLVRLVRLVRVAKMIKIVQSLLTSRAELLRKNVRRSLDRLVSNFSEEELMEKFRHFDQYDSDSLSTEEIKKFLADVMYQKRESDSVSIAVGEFMTRFDRNNDGNVTALEFKHGLTELRFEQEEREELEEQGPQLSVGKKFIDRTTIWVILIVLSLVVVLPFLNIQYGDKVIIEKHLDTSGLSMLHTFAGNFPHLAQGAQSPLAAMVHEFVAKTKPIFVELQNLPPQQVKGWASPQGTQWKTITEIKEDYRPSEIAELILAGGCDAKGKENNSTGCISRAVYDISSYTRLLALMSLVQTLVVMVLLMLITTLLTHDARYYLLGPIERMSQLVQKLKSDPLARLSTLSEDKNKKTGNAGYETHLLESTLTKIASLVQIGFGSAGAAIIKQNMTAGEFDPMVRGRKMYGVFGFCDIRNFTDATECLKEEVMVFTNKIGFIVHSAVDSFQGSANKNIGDAFLLVWKIAKEGRPLEHARVERLVGTRPMHLLSPAEAKKIGVLASSPRTEKRVASRSSIDWGYDGIPTMADNALMAFMKCRIDIRNSTALEIYRDDPLLMQRFEYPYTVKMGYGLHVGWAIEGAIGSLYKIDASYLAPDVNMSSRLEAATKQFGVPLLMSHSFHNMLSPSISTFSRCIDCVTVKGSEEPLGLYTCDITNARVLQFNGVDDFPACQDKLPRQFFTLFRRGMSAYFAGKWPEARELLTSSLNLKPNDGPTETLMKVMSADNFSAPADWKGYRQLKEK